MDNVTEVIFNERQGLAREIMDPDNERIIVLFLHGGLMTWDFIGEIGRHEMIGALHDLINQQLNNFDDEEEQEEN